MTPDDPPRRPTSQLEREIAQQPTVWRELAAALDDADDLRSWVAERLSRVGRVVLVGAGTSAYIGEVAAPHLSRLLDRRVEAVPTTTLVADPRGVLVPDVSTLLVSFARSGDSPESVASCDLADQLLSDVFHLVVTCNPHGELARTHGVRPGSRVVLMPPAADDQSFAMTSSFTSMLLAALVLLGGATARGVAESAALAAESVLGRRAEVEDLARHATDRVFYLGSGPLAGLARELALKLTEVTAGRVLGLPESSLGFRHGPKAALTTTTLVLVLVSNDPYTRAYDLDILRELVSALPAGHVVAVTARPSSEAVPDGVVVISTEAEPGLPDGFAAFPVSVVGQLLALEAAVRLDLDPDLPFPGGEVNRVVEGVRIHSLR